MNLRPMILLFAPALLLTQSCTSDDASGDTPEAVGGEPGSASGAGTGARAGSSSNAGSGATGATDSGDAGDSGLGASGGTGGEEPPKLPSAKAKAIAVGRLHSCAVTTAGAVRCWGASDHGQIGNGVVDASSAGVFSTPVQVKGLTSGVTSIATAFGDHTCVVVSGGVKCWGANDQGQLGDGSTDESAEPVAVVGLDSGVVAVAAGEQNSCALLASGAVKCWGKNDFGQLGDDSEVESSPEPVDVAGLTDAASIAAGLTHVCVVTTTKAMKCWGSNLYAELGLGSSGNGAHTPGAVPDLTNVASIATGDGVTCAATAAGALSCWGKNADGQIGNGESGTQLQQDTPAAVTGLSSGTSGVSSGYGFTCAVQAGAAKCWGSNFNLVLGNGEGASFTSDTPVDVTSLDSDVTAIAATSSDHVCALLASGAVQCWGSGSGALGQGTTDNSPVPGAVVSLP